MARRQRDDGGQAMVEFALVLPIVLLLLFGMTQFALVLNARQTVGYAAEAAANGYAQTLVRATADGDAYGAAAQLSPRLSRAGSVTYTLIHGATESAITADGVGALGDLVAAHVTYGFPSPVRAGLGGFHFPDTLPITAEAIARIEKPGSSGAGASAPPAPAAPPPVRALAPATTANPSPSASPERCWSVSMWHWPVDQEGLLSDVGHWSYYADAVIDGRRTRWSAATSAPGTMVATMRAAPGTTHSAYAEFSLYGWFVWAPPQQRTVTHSFTLPSAGGTSFRSDEVVAGYPFDWGLHIVGGGYGCGA